MTVGLNIEDGGGSSRRARVLKDQELKVAVSRGSAANYSLEELTRYKQFRSFATDSDGSSDLAVTGSLAAPQMFTVKALPQRVLYVQQLRFVLNSTYMDVATTDLRRFGSAAGVGGLANGLLCSAIQGGIESSLFYSPVCTTGDFLVYCDSFLSFPNAIDVNVDLLSLDFNFAEPVVLPQGSTDCISVVVQDDLASLNLFQVMCKGWQEVIE